MPNFIFIVNCERIRKTGKYNVYFRPNDQLTNRIKALPSGTKKWISDSYYWEITTRSLYEVIKIYKKSTKIRFDFGSDEGKKAFLEQIIKLDKDRIEKERLLVELNKKKVYWSDFKKQIEKDYLKHSDNVHKALNKDVRLYPHQITTATFLQQVRNALISHEMGLGKANPVDSKLLTPNGWIRMGDVKVGDYVIGSNGKPTKVLNIFPQGEKDIYELKFNDGTTAQSCDEHLWNVNTYIRNWRKNPFLTKTLRELIVEGLQYKNGNNKHYIPIVKPIKFQKRNLKINPYVLGCLLGDGGITVKNSISFSSIDKQIIIEIENRLPEKHKMVLNGKSIKDYYLTADGKNNYINQYLKKYNLKGCNSYTKFIPNEYLFSSINQRLEILQGILDTDGHSRKDSIIELTLASKKLIKDVQFIVQSLGGIGRLKPKYVIYKGEKRKYYRLTIKLPPQFVPFKLQRKIDTFVPPSKYLPNRAIKEINYVGKKEAQCILVDADDHLYVIDNCVVTHNTLSAIAYVEMNDFNKVFVITPNSLKFNFYDEIEKFSDSKAHIINWKKNSYSLEEAKYVIVNYEFFSTTLKQVKKMDKKFKELGIEKIDCLICDESHRLKNTNSNTYKNFKRIFKKDIDSKVFLSGTPAPNKAAELYTVLNQISPLEFPTKDFYYKNYLGMEYDLNVHGGWVKNPTMENLEQLYHNIEPYTHRKRKQEVLTDLPDKIFQKVILEMTPKQVNIYEDVEQGIANEYLNEDVELPITRMLRSRQYTSSLKVSTMIEFIDRMLDEGEKIVVMDYFTESLIELKNHYGEKACLHIGDYSVEDRRNMIREFQDPTSNINIFLGTIQTSKEGLTLTAANKIFLITLPYVPGEFDQVIDRLHRIGQKDVVNAYFLIFIDTIDEYVFDAIERKQKEISKVIDNIDFESNVGESVMGEVMAKIAKKHGKSIV